jgi:hypothetical protein
MSVLDSDSDSYHLFASFMCNHQTLDAWTTVSGVALLARVQ